MEATWGGRLQSEEQMIQFESFSILINLLLLLPVSTKAGYIKVKIPPVVITAFLWLFAALFVLNTFGNLMATNIWEKVIFTPMTALLAIFFWRMAVEKSSKPAAS